MLSRTFVHKRIEYIIVMNNWDIVMNDSHKRNGSIIVMSMLFIRELHGCPRTKCLQAALQHAKNMPTMCMLAALQYLCPQYARTQHGALQHARNIPAMWMRAALRHAICMPIICLQCKCAQHYNMQYACLYYACNVNACSTTKRQKQTCNVNARSTTTCKIHAYNMPARSTTRQT